MAYTIKKDPLNEFVTAVLNDLLNQLGLAQIQPNELKDLNIMSRYQGTNRPETTIMICCKTGYNMISINFKKGKITSSGWTKLE